MKDSIALCGYSPRVNVYFYVSSLPGQGGVDWEWTTDRKKAIALTPHWQRRFAADARYLQLRGWFCSPVGEYRPGASECSICRRRHGREVEHACE